MPPFFPLARFARPTQREKQSVDDNDDNTEINIMGSSANPDDRGKMGDEDEEDKSGEAEKVSEASNSCPEMPSLDS
jgi:hypothetical protein